MTDRSAPQDARAETFRRGARRRHTTPWSVRAGERLAGGVITVGGLLVIVAVFGIMVFLASVVAPLMAGGSEEEHYSYTLPVEDELIWVNADQYRTLGLGITSTGDILNYHVPTGEVVSTDSFDFEGREVTSVAGTLDREDLIFGFDDGTVRFATALVEVESMRPEDLPPESTELSDTDWLMDGTIYSRVGTGDYRTLLPENTLGEIVEVADTPIIAVDIRTGGTRERPTISFATVSADGNARVSNSRIQRNMMTGEETVSTDTVELPDLDLPDGVNVTDILLAGRGDRAIISTDDGVVFRYDLRDFDNPVMAERYRVAAEDVAVSAMTYLSGRQALVVGGSDGSLGVFFRLQSAVVSEDGPPPILYPDVTDAGFELAAATLQVAGEGTADGYELVRAREHAPMPAAVVDIAEGQRDKSFVATDAKGNVRVIQSTSDIQMFEFQRSGDPSVPSTAMGFARGDGAILVSERGEVDVWVYDDPHAEITLGTLFGEVWYEGYNSPGFTWQSTAGTDEAEPKYSLVPLIFGTIKAATYAMLFATPIALMAAIYTSEFVHRGVRATVKPVMELMESLPTVVLGFVAALVLAPIVEEWVAAVLLGFIALPLGLMLGAFAWQTLPPAVVLRLDGFPKFVFMIATVIATGWVSYGVGPIFEEVLFQGDFKAWTAGNFGTGTPFMTLILLPVSYLAIAWSFRRIIGHRYREVTRARARSAAGRLDMGRWVVFLAAAIGLAWLLASTLTLIGYDPRGGFVDSYAQRNALVVGFIMAFAVIPNIYTLAEDALNSVPGHLRAGSLAAGATPWQTATWIVLPTAASGVFSAVMMGMGRAVGETMIVVMAAGNTAIMDWNIFAGLRTLSANIAIELPEAVRDGTNYRVLFLAALTLFIMTFVINTLAELIRQRFRKRAFQL